MFEKPVKNLLKLIRIICICLIIPLSIFIFYELFKLTKLHYDESFLFSHSPFTFSYPSLHQNALWLLLQKSFLFSYSSFSLFFMFIILLILYPLYTYYLYFTIMSTLLLSPESIPDDLFTSPNSNPEEILVVKHGGGRPKNIV